MTPSANRLRLVAAWALVLALTGAGDGSGAEGAAATEPPPRGMVVAAFAGGGVSLTARGSALAEVPWMLPGDVDPVISPDGARLAFASARDGDFDIYVADARTGTVTRLTSSEPDDRHPAWSPDGSRIAWARGGPDDADVRMMRDDGRGRRLLAGGPGAQVDPAWSPDGSAVAFVSTARGNHDLWQVSARGGPPALLLDDRAAVRSPSWHPSGTRLAVVVGPGSRADVGIVQAGSGAFRIVATTPAAERRPEWSPDGTALLVTRVRHGRTGLWLLRPDGSAKAVPGTDGVADADWGWSDPFLAPGPERRLPDLDQQAPRGLTVTRDEDGRVRLGFASAVDSLGPGALVIRGTRRPGRSTMRADQIVETAGSGTLVVPGVGRLRYEPHSPHRHWHLQPFVRYELRRAGDLERVGSDRKAGFCLIDRYGRSSKNVPQVARTRFTDNCAAGQADALTVEEGSSPGYVDRYPAFFHGQDVDITGVPPGAYVLVHQANPDRGMRERRYTNNGASLLIRLTGPRREGGLPRVEVLRRCPETEVCPPPG